MTSKGCPACGGESGKIVLEHCIDVLHECPGEWSLVECTGCGLISISPMPADDQIPALYPADYSPFHPARPLTKSRAGTFLRQVAILPYTCRFGATDRFYRPFGGRRLLDIGCGAGTFLRAMVERGWNAAGLDTNPFAVSRARLNAPQATVYLGTLETSQPEGPYDLIVMNHVLEHLPRPVECLERCFGLLAPSGVLQIAVPNLHSFEAAAFGKSWRGLDVPRHLTHFRESTLVRLLEGCGYRAVSARPQLFPSSLSESLLLTLPRGLRRRLLGSGAARVLYVLSIIPAAVLNLFGNRAVIEIRASKPANA